MHQGVFVLFFFFGLHRRGLEQRSERVSGFLFFFSAHIPGETNDTGGLTDSSNGCRAGCSLSSGKSPMETGTRLVASQAWISAAGIQGVLMPI